MDVGYERGINRHLPNLHLEARLLPRANEHHIPGDVQGLERSEDPFIYSGESLGWKRT